MVAWGWEGASGLTAKGPVGAFWDDEKFRILIVVVVTRMYIFVKTR